MTSTKTSACCGSCPPPSGRRSFAAVLLTTAAAALAMSGRQPVRVRGPGRGLLLGYGWSVVAILLLVVPDYEVLVIAGYSPMLLLASPSAGHRSTTPRFSPGRWPTKFFAVAGGLLLARTVLTWQFHTAGAWSSCGGRRHAGAGWTSADSATRWGRWAVVVAAVIPVLYAITRFAWAVGIPLGIKSGELADMQESGLVWAGAGLAAFGVVGAVLTVGLIRPWGERFPRWMPGLAGRRVPVMLAVVPAGLVAVAVTAASLALFSQAQFWAMMGGLNPTSVPMALWVVWGVALGAAAFAYHRRLPPLRPDRLSPGAGANGRGGEIDRGRRPGRTELASVG